METIYSREELEKEWIVELINWAKKYKVMEILNIHNDVLCIDKEKAFLELYKLKLSDKNIYDLPDTIMYFENLTHLDLSNNKIQKFPNIIFELKKLKILDISFNSIKNIPIEITQLEKLKYLNFDWNNIDAIPNYLKFGSKSWDVLCTKDFIVRGNKK